MCELREADGFSHVKQVWIGSSCIALLLTSIAVWAQAPAQSSGASEGHSTGAPRAPVYDAQKRPITAGGFVDSGPIVFQDVTRTAGLDKWKHLMGTPQKKYILETDGSGVA